MNSQAVSTSHETNLFPACKRHSEADGFLTSFSAAINCMLQDDAVGGVIAIKPGGRVEVIPHEKIEALARSSDLHSQIKDYELILFDGGNIHGDNWKHTFYPKQMVQTFVSEN